jgi:hypothetical protein
MEYKSFMEALKGNQHKIDKNKNGKVDAHDFKLLRKEETEELEEATVKTQKYSWGTMKTVHHGSDFSIPLHPEHHQAIAKLKDQQEHKFKTEDGRHWTAKKSGEDVHFQSANDGPKTTVKHNDLKESEDRHHGMNNWRKPVKEETISEATVKTQKYSWGTMKTIHHGSSFSIPLHPEHHQAIAKLKDEQEHKFKDETGRHWTARRKGEDVHFQGANDGPKTTVKHSTMSEEVKDDYARKVDTHLKNKYAPVAPTLDKKYIKGTPENKAHREKNKPINGMPTGQYSGPAKLNREEVDQIEEDKMTTKKDKNGKLISFKYEGDWKKSTEKKQGSGKAANLAGQAMQKMAKANEAVSPVSVKVNHALEAPHEEEWEDTGICPEHNKKDCHQCGKAGMKEQVEEIQEKSDQAKQNKTMKNVMAASKGAKLNRDSGLKLTPGDTGHSNAQQMNKALGRHAMREQEGLKSYKEFMMMLEYESDKSGSYTHKGSYGSEFAKKEREKDEKGFDSENEPAKRGPKMGSKRGPKANLGSSKLHTK